MAKIFYLISLFCFCTFSVHAQSETTVSEQTSPVVVQENTPTQTTEQTKEQQIDPKVLAFIENLKKNKNKSFSYTLEFSEKNQKKSIKIFQKAEKIRMEFFPYEGSLKEFTKMVVFSDGKTFYTYLPKINILTRSKTKIRITYPSPEELDGYVLGEKRKINGLDCQMIINQKNDTEFCINENLGLPIYSKDPSNSSKILDIKEENLDDSLFTPPPGASVF